MKEYGYTILYKKETIENNQYLFLPCYVIKGVYEEKEHIFLDELNKTRFLYTDINIIGEQCNYCVGEIYTEEELREKFPEANSIEDLQISLFAEEEKNLTIGKYQSNSTQIKISRIKDTDQIENQKREVKNQNTTYRQMFEMDYVEIPVEKLELILQMENIEEIKALLKERKQRKNEPVAEAAVGIDTQVIDKLLELKEIHDIKEQISGYLEFFKELERNFLGSDQDEQNEYSDQYLDIEEIIRLTDETYQGVMSCTEKGEVDELIEILIGEYQFALKELLACKNYGVDYFKSITYFYTQTQLLHKIKKEENKEIEKSKYRKLYQSTRHHLNQVAAEFDLTPEKMSQDLAKEVDQVMTELNHLVGLENVKRELEEIFDTLIFKQKTKNNLSFDEASKHMIFTGNPGTGKTTVAELIAPLFYQLGYLQSSKVAYASAQDLVGKYVGQTAPKTESFIKKNLGGVIVVDEAYILAGEAQEFGNEAITVILKEMEKNRTMFIFAGYKKEMEQFIKMNSGLESRIGTFLDFQDYTVDELVEIFHQKLEDVNDKEVAEYQLTMTEDALNRIRKVIAKATEKDDFGNGRFIQKLFDKISRNHARNTKYSDDPEELYQITKKDIPDDILETIFFGETEGLYSNTKMGFNGDLEEKKSVQKVKRRPRQCKG